MSKVILAWKGHYEVEFKFDGKFYYVENNFKADGQREICVYTEAEYLLNYEQKEPLIRFVDTDEEQGITGELPAGMCFVLEKAMELGRAESDK